LQVDEIPNLPADAAGVRALTTFEWPLYKTESLLSTPSAAQWHLHELETRLPWPTGWNKPSSAAVGREHGVASIGGNCGLQQVGAALVASVVD
jgi:hypothetical protein